MTHDSPGTNRENLTRHAYADDSKLNIRREIHARYTVPAVNFSEWVLDQVAWQGDERVLDVGAGPGSYAEEVQRRIPAGRYVAGDLSFGMLRRQQMDADTPRRLVDLDVQRLPFPSNTFDRVLANHMLYHVPDIDAALREIERVLKPDGLLLAATNSAANMPEFNTLYRRALLILTSFEYRDHFARPETQRFSLESGLMQCSRHFYAVARYDLPAALIFTEPDPVIAYLDSLRDLQEANLPAGITWDAFIEVMRQQVTRLIDHTERLAVRKLTGVLVATNRGGFAREFVHSLEHAST
ncbi:MAG: hypothetical protein Kow0077_25890 [Anaerolineae bacterium]